MNEFINDPCPTCLENTGCDCKEPEAVKFEQMYKTHLDVWIEVDNIRALRILGDHYADVDFILEYMKDGNHVNTMFSYIRIKEE